MLLGRRGDDPVSVKPLFGGGGDGSFFCQTADAFRRASQIQRSSIETQVMNSSNNPGMV
jgi:biotin carboxylase